MKRTLSTVIAAAILLCSVSCKMKPRTNQMPTGASFPISMEHSFACADVLHGQKLTFWVESRMIQLGDYVLFPLYQPNPDHFDQIPIYDAPAIYSLTADALIVLEQEGFPIGAVQEGNTFSVLFQKDKQYSMVTYDGSFHEIDTVDCTDNFSAIPEDARELRAWHRTSDGSEFVIDGKKNLHYYDAEGKYIGILTDGFDQIIETADGLYATGMIGETMLCEIHPETRSAEMLKIPDMPTFCTGYYGNQNTPYLYLDTCSQLWQVDVSENTAEIVMDYEASDLDATMTMAVPLAGDEILLAQRHTDGYAMYRAHERTQEEINSMQLISLAAFSENPTLNALIRRWNRQSDSVRIVVKTYLSFSGSFPTIEERETSEQNFAKFKEELLSGIVPDIICLDDVNYTMLSNKGMFEDLRPWMKQDPDFREEDYFMNLFESLSYQNRIERISLSFGVSTAIAKAEFLNGKTAISIEEYDELSASLPEGMYILPQHESCTSLLHSTALVQSDCLINDEKSSCRFDSKEFVKLLELCSLGNSGKERILDDDAWQENRALLYPASIYSFTDYHGIASIRFADAPITLTGVPKARAESSSGYFLPSGIFAVSSNSLYKEEIWEFIKFALKEEEQLARESELYSFPVNKNAFQLLFEAESNRNQQLQPQSIFMNETEHLAGTPTESEKQALLQHIEELSAAYVYDLSLNSIIQEEAEMYFSGDCTAEEAARKIQGRVRLYLAERS